MNLPPRMPPRRDAGDDERCPACNRLIGLYEPDGCEDDSGQSWCIAHLPDGHPQSSLNLRLPDGRPVTVDSVHVRESTAGLVYTSSPQRAWHQIAGEPTTTMPGSYGELPTFAIPPVSVRGDVLLLPRWKVYARLNSHSMQPPSSPLGGGSHLVLVFFCNDIASKPITALIADRLVYLNERTWREHARDWEP